jgi:uncharacterized protein
MRVMSIAGRVEHALSRMYDRGRSPDAIKAATMEPTGSIDDLKGHKYCVLVSYKKDGTPVPSPLWFGVVNGKLYAECSAGDWKTKRIRRNPQVRVAPSDTRGKPTGPPFIGTARVVDESEAAAADRAVQSNYGSMRRLHTFFIAKRVDCAYLEVTPAV